MADAQRAPLSAMAKSLLRLIVISAFGSFGIILALLSGHVLEPGQAWSGSFTADSLLMMCIAVAASAALYSVLKKIAPFIDTSALAQARFLDTLDLKYADAAIIFAAALSLFMELGCIRWQSSVLPFFALYKNFSLLACFVGLGLGYALATRDRIPLVIVIPMLAWQFGLTTILRYAPDSFLTTLPFVEQLAMGTGASGEWQQIFFLYGILTVVFLITALTFMPVGQLCGRLMERRTKLWAYGLNLLGSLLGVLLMLLASFLWTPPLAWFALCFFTIILFTVRMPSLIMVGVSFTVLCTIVLVWPVNPLWNRIYSPYQLLEIGRSQDTGLTLIKAAGHYYQRIHDFSDTQTRQEHDFRTYYDFAYHARGALANVAVVGAGTGNDVAAALRSGAGHVEAIEIDPAILLAGKVSHPEKPYSDPRVHAVVNDARSFLRTTEQTFDLIVYGLLDSHTLLSQGSSVRLDSVRIHRGGLARGTRPPETQWYAVAGVHPDNGSSGSQNLPHAAGSFRRKASAMRGCP